MPLDAQSKHALHRGTEITTTNTAGLITFSSSSNGKVQDLLHHQTARCKIANAIATTTG